MMPQDYREAHRVEVVECGLFATPKSLKSRVGRNLKSGSGSVWILSHYLKSPFSKPRAITPKLYTHSRLAAGENRPASKPKLRALLSSRSVSYTHLRAHETRH